MKKQKNIGINVSAPKEKCENDINCPFHGSISLRGRMLTAKVIRTKTMKNAVVSLTRKKYVPKYERYEKRTTKLQVHNPDCINAQVNDDVKIMETRKISKTKSFVIISKV